MFKAHLMGCNCADLDKPIPQCKVAKLQSIPKSLGECSNLQVYSYTRTQDISRVPWTASHPAHWPARTLSLPLRVATTKMHYSYVKLTNAQKSICHNILRCRFWTWVSAISRRSHHGWVNSANCNIWGWSQRLRASKGMHPSQNLSVPCAHWRTET